MAIGIHIAHVALMNVNLKTGLVINKNSASTSINDMLETEKQHRVIYNPEIPSTTGNPTTEQYLKNEAQQNYVVRYFGQHLIVTYNKSDENAA